MRSILWTSLFWILVVAGLGIYTKWFNAEWAQVVSNFVYEQNSTTGSSAVDEETISTQLILMNTKLDAILSGNTSLQNDKPVEQKTVDVPSSSSHTEGTTIEDLEARIKALESKQIAE